ncbi:MAG TPA: hypothetical protein VFM93_06350 [Candidatus Limnocylindria bacterium]|nr:hypothetical protein [Candidatus Limnocylindria bacterium]
MKHRSWLLRLFPGAWRERYGDEFEALLEDLGPHSPVAADVLLAALRAWLARRRSLGSGSRTGVSIARVVLSLILAVAPVATGAVGYYLGSREREADVPTSYESAFRNMPGVGTLSTGKVTVFCLDGATGTWVVLPTGSGRCPAAP